MTTEELVAGMKKAVKSSKQENCHCQTIQLKCLRAAVEALIDAAEVEDPCLYQMMPTH